MSKHQVLVTPAVRVTGPPNSHIIIGYPGVPATMPRIMGKVEIRPDKGISAPVPISSVSIGLYRREYIHPGASSIVGGKLGSAPKREHIDLIGEEMRLFKCVPGRSHEDIFYMDLPFVIFLLPDSNNKLPPASLQLANKSAETSYELVVSIQQGAAEKKRWPFHLEVLRYDTLSTYGMFEIPEEQERISDHLVTLISHLPRWCFGPLDPVLIRIKVVPNPDWMRKAKKVTVQKLTVGLEEHITYNPEGDEPTTKVNKMVQKKEIIGQKLGEDGFMKEITLPFPERDRRDGDGHLPRLEHTGQFPQVNVGGFTTTAKLYRVEYFVTVKASFSGCKDIQISQKIVVCPFDAQMCRNEMAAISQAAIDARGIDPTNPMLPSRVIIPADNPKGLEYLGITYVGKSRKPLID